MRIFKTIVVFIISGVICFWLSVVLLLAVLQKYDETAWFLLLVLGLTLTASIAISNYMYKNVFSPSAIANREEKRQKLIKEKKEVIAKHNVGPLRAYVTLNIGKTILIVSCILFIIILLVNVIIMKMAGL